MQSNSFVMPLFFVDSLLQYIFIYTFFFFPGLESKDSTFPNRKAIAGFSQVDEQPERPWLKSLSRWSGTSIGEVHELQKIIGFSWIFPKMDAFYTFVGVYDETQI